MSVKMNPPLPAILAAEAGGEEVTRLYVTYETITVEKTIHKVRRAVSHAEPGNGDAADETAGGSEASDAAEASSGESAAQEEEFTETVEGSRVRL